MIPQFRAYNLSAAILIPVVYIFLFYQKEQHALGHSKSAPASGRRENRVNSLPIPNGNGRNSWKTIKICNMELAAPIYPLANSKRKPA
jgi:hypothetical protein